MLRIYGENIASCVHHKKVLHNSIDVIITFAPDVISTASAISS